MPLDFSSLSPRSCLQKVRLLVVLNCPLVEKTQTDRHIHCKTFIPSFLATPRHGTASQLSDKCVIKYDFGCTVEELVHCCYGLHQRCKKGWILYQFLGSICRTFCLTSGLALSTYIPVFYGHLQFPWVACVRLLCDITTVVGCVSYI